MANFKRNGVYVMASAAVLLSACGGGGGGSSDSASANAPVLSAEGAWEGTLTNSTASNFQLLVLDTGEFWALYGRPVSGFFAVSGFIQGTGSITGGNLNASNAKDFGFSPAVNQTVQATYTSSAIQGTVNTGTSAASFSGAPLPTTNYTYARAALLSEIQGAWTLQGTDGSTVNVSIGASGAFTATSAGCAISGTFTPRPSGKNVFNVSLTFGGSPCATPGTSASGVAVTYPTTANNRQLIVLGTNAARTAGVGLFGAR